MKYTRKVLKNGLNVFLMPIADAESVVFTILVKVGSRYEQAGEEGVAHFLEHVFFKGSKKYPEATSISTLIDAIGGDFNAGTSKESTEFYIRSEQHHFDLIFDVLTDMVQNPLFKEEELAKEKGVVIEEINLYQDNPGAQVESNLEKIMWPQSKLGKEIIGTKSSITKMTRRQVVGFKERFYRPGNIILGVAGAFNSAKVLKKIEKGWGGLPKASTSKAEPVKEKQNRMRVELEHRGTNQAHLVLGFKSHGHGHKNNAAIILLANILGGGMSSRLFTIIREQKGLAYSVYASNTPYADTGNFRIHAGLKVEKTTEAVAAIAAELRKIKKEPVSAIELKRAKDHLRGRVALGLEDNQEKLNWVMERFAFTGKPMLPKDLFKKIDKVTTKDISRVAGQLFTAKNLSLALIGPFKNRAEFEKQLRLD